MQVDIVTVKKIQHAKSSLTWVWNQTIFPNIYFHFGVWEQLLGGARAPGCNAVSSILAFGSCLSPGHIAGRSLEYHIHAWQCMALPYCSRNVFLVGLSPAGNRCPATASCALTLPPGEISQRFSPPRSSLSLCWSLAHLWAPFYISQIRANEANEFTVMQIWGGFLFTRK